MQLFGRALYNAILYNEGEELLADVELWQRVNYRALSLEEIFLHLEESGISFDESRFLTLAEERHSPEDLLECIAFSKQEKEKEKIYLLLFELWRRLCRDRPSLSIFCDALDHAIDEDLKTGNEERVHMQLKALERLLYDHVSRGEDGREVFQVISSYCAYSLEEFLFAFISDHIEADGGIYASELIDAFLDFVERPLWLRFLQIKVIALTSLPEATSLFYSLAESLKEAPDLKLSLEILGELPHMGLYSLSFSFMKETLLLIETEGELRSLLETLAHSFAFMGDKGRENEVHRLLKSRQTAAPGAYLKNRKGLLKTVENLLLSS